MPSKHPTRSLLWIVIGALAVMMLGGQLFGQTQAFTATLNGSVTDPSGAAVPGAKVTLTSPERGITRTFTTDSEGLYTFTLLPPGTYNLQVAVDKFSPYKQTGITLAAGQTAQQIVALKLGSETTEVQVTADAPLLNVENANIAADISERQVQELPLNLRNVFSLSMLNSSVNNSSEYQVVGGNGINGVADQDVSFFNFGGTFFGTQAFLLDGTWDTGADWGGVVYVPSVDNVQEFKIQTNAFTSQYGWSSGNIVNVVTKSGTNGFHGSAYEFYRNSALDAKYYFVDKKPDFNRNQYGTAFGGPVRIPGLYNGKDKTFFFFNYEGVRSSTPAAPSGYVPTEAMKSGDFSSQLGAQVGTDALGRAIYAGAIYNPFSTRQITAGQVDSTTGLIAAKTGWIRDAFAGNKVPSTMFDSIAKKMLGFWPNPNATASTFNYIQSASSPFTSDEYSIRLDHNFTENTRIYGRFSKKLEQKTNAPEYYGSDDVGGPGVIAPNNRWSTNVNLNHVFSPTFAGSLNLGLNRWVEASHVQSFGYKPSTLGLPAWIDPISPIFPLVQPSGVLGLGPGAGNGLDEYMVPRNNFTAALDFTKVKGAHSMSFGFTDILNQLNGGHFTTTTFTFNEAQTAGPDPNATTAGTGASMASFLLGVGNSGFTGYNAWPATSKHYLGTYFQDDWKVNSKLTLNLGIRYEIQTAPIDSHNRQVYFDPTAVNPISSKLGFSLLGADVYNTSSNRGLYNTSLSNIAPRVGLAYRVTNKLAFRGGYGLFFVPSFPGNGPNQGYSQQTPWVTSTFGVVPKETLSTAFSGGQIPPRGSANAGLQDVGYGTTAVYPTRNSPYVEQWMAGLEYSITDNDLLDITYVGNHGTHMLASGVQRNQVPTAVHTAMGAKLDEVVANPFYGVITSSGCGLADPTIQRGQLMRPFPQYCSVYEVNAPVGTSWYDALQASYTHRWKSGLSILASYTYSKFLDNVNGASGWAFVGSNLIRDFNNLAAEKSVDGNDIPHSLVVNYIYELPFGKGKKFGSGMNAVANGILGGWQISGVTTFKSGFPLSITCPDNSHSWGGGGQRCDLVGNPVPDNQSISNWINAAAFKAPAAYTYGNSARYLSNLRAPHYNNTDLAIQKYWFFKPEGMKLQFRAEMFNAFNHPNFYAPGQNVGSGNFGKISNTLAPRDVQMGVKFYW